MDASASPASDTLASRRPVAGSLVSKLAPSLAATHSPAMNRDLEKSVASIQASAPSRASGAGP